jgi:hypothetical protein
MRRPEAFREVESVSDAYSVPTLGLADVLQQRPDDFFLFTPALLLTHSDFDRDPVVEFAVRMPAEKDLMPFCIDLHRDNDFFFTGLGEKRLPGKQKVVNWDRRIYCVPAARKDDCVAFIGGIIFSNPRTGLFGSSFYYDMQISDPTSQGKRELQLGVFGVRTNKRISFLLPRISGPAVATSVAADKLFLCPPRVIEACALATQIPTDPLSMRDDKNA